MNLPLRDIKPNVEIIDYQWYVFLAFVCVIILLAMYGAYRLYKKHKRPTPKQTALNLLKTLDYTDPKKVAYEFPKIAKILINEKNKALYTQITNELQKHKYKPKVEPIDESLKEKIEEFTRLSNEF